MRNITKTILLFILCSAMAFTLLSCAPKIEEVSVPPSVEPIDEINNYRTKTGYYKWPSLVDSWVWDDALFANTDDGEFYCFTDDESVANAFINSQRTLIAFLRKCGVSVDKLTVYGIDYDIGFSESGKKEAYVAIDTVNTYRQVLVTLGAIWGDYIDYGYVYAMSNAIADHLGWETDNSPEVSDDVLSNFFSGNPDGLMLQYPSFTEEYADAETVICSKFLAKSLLSDVVWHEVLAEPIDSQLDKYYSLAATYAETHGILFERSALGYAYYSERVPLRIMTTYAEMFIDDEFAVSYAARYGDEVSDTNPEEMLFFFGDCYSIYRTAEILDSEIVAAVEYFGLQDRAGIAEIKWLTGESAIKLYDKPLANFYSEISDEVTLTIMNAFLNEYYHHLEHILNPDLGAVWQSQAFCEIGHINSYFTRQLIKDMVLTTPELDEIFEEYTGHSYTDEYADYYETYDILTYIYNDFDPTDYYSGRNPMISFNRYLTDIYGLDAVYGIMLFPDTVESTTGKTWDSLIEEWVTHLKSKYEGKEIPDWLDKFGM